MERIRDRFWIWGHEAGSHNGLWAIDTPSRMTPTEGALYMGLSRIVMVCFAGKPQPPFDREALAMDCMDEVIWSVVGDAGSKVEPGSLGHLDEIMRIAETHPNVKGVIFDDFFDHGGRPESFNPTVLRGMRERLNARGLSMWVVMYTKNMDRPIKGHIDEFDGVTLWTMDREEMLGSFDGYFGKASDMVAGKRLLLGCYMYNYGKKCQLSAKDMEFQIETYVRAIRAGKAEGIILLTNAIADLGYEAVEYVRSWLREHGDEPV